MESWTFTSQHSFYIIFTLKFLVDNVPSVVALQAVVNLMVLFISEEYPRLTHRGLLASRSRIREVVHYCRTAQLKNNIKAIN